MRRANSLLSVLTVALQLGSCTCGGPENALSPSLSDAPTFEARVRALRDELGEPEHDRLTDESVGFEHPDSMTPLARALRRTLQEGHRTHIAAYGGSHTASDLYTGVIRTSLQRAFGDGGHGFVLPVPPISRYWQEGARVAEGDGWETIEPSPKRTGIDRYGLAGIAFESSERAFAEVATDGTSASRIEVMYASQTGGGTLLIDVDGAEHILSTDAEPLSRVAVYGVPEGSHRVQLRSAGDGPVRIYGVVFEREGSGGVVLDQLGLAGAKARHHLLWDEREWESLLRTRGPDFFLVSYGNNETDDHHLAIPRYQEHFERMLTRLRSTFPQAGCLVIGPSEREYRGPRGTWKVPSLLPILIEMQRATAQAQGCSFFDVFAWQGGSGAVERWLRAEPPLQRDDHVHFTEAGYRRLGRALLRRMLDALQ